MRPLLEKSLRPTPDARSAVASFFRARAFLIDRRRLAVLRAAAPWIVAVAILALRMPLVPAPLDRDEGGFAYAGWAWLQGALPYRDVFDNKAPLLYLAYAFFTSVFGRSASGVHLGFLLVTLAQAWLFWRLARRFMGSTAGLAATLLFAALASEPSYAVGTAGTPSQLVLLPLLAAAVCLRTSPLWAGLLIGAAIMTKQTAVLHAAAFAFVLGRANAGALLRFAGATLIVPTLAALYFAAHGAWAPFLEAVFRYNLQHAGAVAAAGRWAEGWASLADNVGTLAWPEGTMWALAVVGVIFVARRLTGSMSVFEIRASSLAGTQGRTGVEPRDSTRFTTPDRSIPGLDARLPTPGLFTGSLLLLWSLSAVASVCVSFRFLSHYFVELAPVVALAAGVALQSLRRKAGLVPMAAACALALLSFAGANRRALFGGSPEAFVRDAYAGNDFAGAAHVAEYLAQTTDPSARIFIFGSEPEILFLAGRRSATRHIFFYPLTLERPTEAARAQARQFQEEVAAEIEARPPDVVVWVNNPLSFTAGPTTDRQILEKAAAWIKSGDYAFEGAVLPGATDKDRFFLGAAAARFEPSQTKEAVYLVYRRRGGRP